VKRIEVVLLILGSLAATNGCGSSGTEQPARQSPPRVGTQEKAKQADKKAGKADAVAAGDDAEEVQVLTATDREAAKKQKFCPVSGEPLGSMGDPYKVQVKNRTVFLCCQSCVVALTNDPDKYLKKLELP
jgi:hypothetical protein